MHRTVPLLALVLALSGCGWVGRHEDTAKPDGFPLRGYVSVAGAAAGVAGSPCLAPAGATDVVAGVEVRVLDAQGAVVASTPLASGVLAQGPDGYRCNFPFELANVSGGRPSYRIVVGSWPAVSFDTRQLREGTPAVVHVATASRSPS